MFQTDTANSLMGEQQSPARHKEGPQPAGRTSSFLRTLSRTLLPDSAASSNSNSNAGRNRYKNSWVDSISKSSSGEGSNSNPNHPGNRFRLQRLREMLRQSAQSPRTHKVLVGEATDKHAQPLKQVAEDAQSVGDDDTLPITLDLDGESRRRREGEDGDSIKDDLSSLNSEVRGSDKASVSSYRSSYSRDRRARLSRSNSNRSNGNSNSEWPRGSRDEYHEIKGMIVEEDAGPLAQESSVEDLPISGVTATDGKPKLIQLAEEAANNSSMLHILENLDAEDRLLASLGPATRRSNALLQLMSDKYTPENLIIDFDDRVPVFDFLGSCSPTEDREHDGPGGVTTGSSSSDRSPHNPYSQSMRMRRTTTPAAAKNKPRAFNSEPPTGPGYGSCLTPEHNSDHGSRVLDSDSIAGKSFVAEVNTYTTSTAAKAARQRRRMLMESGSNSSGIPKSPSMDSAIPRHLDSPQSLDSRRCSSPGFTRLTSIRQGRSDYHAGDSDSDSSSDSEGEDEDSRDGSSHSSNTSMSSRSSGPQHPETGPHSPGLRTFSGVFDENSGSHRFESDNGSVSDDGMLDYVVALPMSEQLFSHRHNNNDDWSERGSRPLHSSQTEVEDYLAEEEFYSIGRSRKVLSFEDLEGSMGSLREVSFSGNSSKGKPPTLSCELSPRASE